MVARYCALVALTVIVSMAARAEDDEAPGIAVGTDAPALTGSAWVSDTGAPDLKGKVYAVDFWFAA